VVVYLTKPTDTIKLRDGVNASNLTSVDSSGRLSTKIFATPDGGTTNTPVACDVNGNILTANTVVVTDILSNFLPAETIPAGNTSTFTMFTVPVGKKYVITDYGVTSIDYAGVAMTLVQDTGSGDEDVLRDKQTATEYMIQRKFTEGLVFSAGTVIKLKITNPQGTASEYDLYMTGREVDV
jgi:hypothetical protein